jgi:hypothetical protein
LPVVWPIDQRHTPGAVLAVSDPPAGLQIEVDVQAAKRVARSRQRRSR